MSNFSELNSDADAASAEAKPIRAEIIERLRHDLTHSESCFSVSGPGNCGKSSLLRDFGRAENGPLLAPIYIDCNLRADDSTPAFYELVLRALLANPKLPGREKLNDAYNQLVSPTATPFTVSRCFLMAMEQLLQALGQLKLVLLLDEFDQPLQSLPGLILLHLRALHDHYPNRLAYVVATGLPVTALGREEQEEGVAEFYELFLSYQLIRLGGLTKAESDKLTCDTTAGFSAPDFTPAQLRLLYELAGGHPVLTRLITRLLIFHPYTTNEEQAQAIRHIRQDSEIQLECQRIWKSLVESEQKSLLQHLEGVKNLSNDTSLGSMAQRGLIVADGDASRIFARSFEWFVREKLQHDFQVGLPPAVAVAAPLPQTISYDLRREIVVLDGGKQRLPLIGNAAKLFKHLYMRQSEPVCTKDELITAIWGTGGYSAENLDKLVSDLRQDIGDHERQIIRTIPRRGLQMVGVAEWKN